MHQSGFRIRYDNAYLVSQLIMMDITRLLFRLERYNIETLLDKCTPL